MSRRGVELLKSILLLFLMIVMLILLAVTWIYTWGNDDRVVPAVRWLREWTGQEEAVAAGEMTFTMAAHPVAAVSGYEGTLYGAARDPAAVAAVYERIKPVLAEALGSAGTPMPVTEWEYRRALERNMAFFAFDGVVPLYALSTWLGSDAPDTLADAGSTRQVLLLAGEEEISLYYLSQETGGMMRIQTAARSRTLLPLLAAMGNNGVQLALSGGEEYQVFAPDVLIEDPGSIARVSADTAQVVPGSGAEMAIFEAFGFNSYTVRKYEDNGAQIYVEALTTIRLSEGGRLSYRTPESEAGIKVSGADAAEREIERRLCLIEAARSLIETVYAGIGGNDIYLVRFVTQEDGRAAAVFGCMVGGIPVVMSDGGAAATVQFKNDRIVSADIALRRYTQIEETSPLIPARQAAALLSGISDKRMLACYHDTGSGLLSAEWYWY